MSLPTRCIVGLALGLIVSVAGCVPTISTVGGHDEAEVRQWAADASERCRQRTGLAPPYPFTTDGCTLWPDGSWQSCCVEHDMAYWCGGRAGEREQADERLRACVVEHGENAIATLLYWGVRVGGHPWLPFYWRWGYGWPWARGYAGAVE